MKRVIQRLQAGIVWANFIVLCLVLIMLGYWILDRYEAASRMNQGNPGTTTWKQAFPWK